MSNPTVSVVIPTYNCARFIGDALASVLAQTYRDFEVVLVDDGSTDDTRLRAESFPPNVKYLYQANRGPATARNTGIQHSCGEYIAFLDADDIWLPRKLERQVEAFEMGTGSDVVYTWWRWINEAGVPLPEVHKPTHQGNVLEKLMRGCFILPSIVMMRRTCFEQAGFFDTRLRHSDDWDILLRIAAQGYQFTFIPEVLVGKRVHEYNLSSEASKSLEDSRVMLDRVLSELPPHLARLSYRETALRNLLIHTSAQFIRQGQLEEAGALFTEGARLQPEILGQPGLYLGLAFSSLMNGHRTLKELVTRRETVAASLTAILCRFFSDPSVPGTIATFERAAWSSLLLILAGLYGLGGQGSTAICMLARALWRQPLVPTIALFRAMRGGLKHVAESFEV
jgi:glycosyltransferase involved in cell wall biosynthesis